ncbi:DNA-binding transcriptional regulator, FrmR family [Izhakiella capsodis]|uniref:DNA-binding transcriptional regulator, FrmR family n=1 Tax=Izhakiella capsodis TaxID=1367852 RepID=A0A1I4VZE5_9GAMM|nr:metal-sensing transcriptional repressor [Izhakiella capsodis]SFN06515.1 DNA-binding transcriptional regulator, FrmR family [Izhakiella capsodis]
MAHTVQDKKKLQARVNRIQGQLSGLGKMLEQEADCDLILQQIAAVRGAINGLMQVVIEGHLHVHLVHESDEDRRASELEIMLKVLKAYMK